MTLTDAGPLIALIDAGEPDHRCRTALENLQLPLLTTWPAFTEAIYLLGRAAGWPGQADATLVALAEAQDLRTIFTLDSDFRTYRPHGRRHLHVIPD